MLWRRRVRQVHRWLGLLIAVQLVFWVAGGFTMAFLDLDAVRGEHRVADQPPADLRAAGALLSPDELLSGIDAAVSGLRLVDWLGRPVYRLDTADGAAVVELTETPHYEIRGRELPLWRVDTHDDLGTRIYVSPSTGEVVARRNNLWRVFDFVWMLHIMDYDERDDFNHPLLLITAGTALLFVFTGLWMLVLTFRR